jgi:hypothetical protein
MWNLLMTHSIASSEHQMAPDLIAAPQETEVIISTPDIQGPGRIGLTRTCKLGLGAHKPPSGGVARACLNGVGSRGLGSHNNNSSQLNATQVPHASPSTPTL